MVSLQEFLFDSPISRTKLLKYHPIHEAKYNIQVYRNHSFELIEHTIRPYLDYAGFQANFSYSDYDDSLSFFHIEEPCDLFILWLDLSRYHSNNIHAFLKQRIDVLKGKISCPILVVSTPDDLELPSPITCLPLKKIREELGERFYDLRMEPFSGTKLSASACEKIAKELGLRYLPALLEPTIKAIAVDLDNTLYHGILGEDGIDNLELTEGHKLLQQELKCLSQKGIFLGAVSKNDEDDVKKMFSQRTDFPLQLEDFTAVYASWDEKSKSLEQFAKYLNIHPDSIVFLDDNIGELSSVHRQIPEIRLLHAYHDAKNTLEVLTYFPGLLRLHSSKEDAFRKKDTQANSIRHSLKESMSEEEYLKNLQIVLSFHLNVPSEAGRIAELSNKTNQFIFNYKRYSEQQVSSLMSDPNTSVISVSLQDRLSDSGIIAAFFAKKDAENVVLEEGFVSCRALGRGLEDYIIQGSIQYLLEHFHADQLKIMFQKGERNVPAEKYIHCSLAGYLESPQSFSYTLSNNPITTLFQKEK